MSAETIDDLKFEVKRLKNAMHHSREVHHRNSDASKARIAFLEASEHGLFGRLETCRQDEAALKARIEQLERELAEAREVVRKQGRDLGTLDAELTAEKALADRLYGAMAGDRGDYIESRAAYRKARGL